MFATGFTLNTQALGEAPAGPTSEFLGSLATEHRIAVVGSFPCCDRPGLKAVNRLLAVGADGSQLATYDKIHPFSYGKETEAYRSGRILPVFDYGGWRVCPTICYDLRFPELYRRATLEAGVELFLVVANWPTARRVHWKTLLRARAIENLCCVAAVNRLGQDPNVSYSGDSQVINERGEILLDCEGREGFEAATLDLTQVREWRERFPALNDATDDFELRGLRQQP